MREFKVSEGDKREDSKPVETKKGSPSARLRELLNKSKMKRLAVAAEPKPVEPRPKPGDAVDPTSGIPDYAPCLSLCLQFVN